MARARIIPLFALLCSCADPAVLEVHVRIEEQNLERLSLRVDRGPPPEMGAPRDLVVDCKLPFGAEPSGSCPFEDGEGKWTNPSTLDFILYGKQNMPLSIAIEGERTPPMGTSPKTVTTTQAVTSLGGEGETRSLSLALYGLTRERSRCGVDVPPVEPAENASAPEANTSVTILSFGGVRLERRILVSAKGRLGFAAYSRNSQECTLSFESVEDPDAGTSATDPKRWCHVAGGSLVASPEGSGANLAFIAAAVCAVGNPRIKAAVAIARRARIFELPPGVTARSQISAPVLADMDGNGTMEVVFLRNLGATAPEPQVALVVWSPRSPTDSWTRVHDLPGVRYDAAIPVAPIVIPGGAGTGDALIIAGGKASFGVFAGTTFTPLGNEKLTARAPIAFVRGDTVELYSATRVGTLTKTVLAKSTRGGFTMLSAEEWPTLTALSDDATVRLSLGPIDAGEERLLIADEGRAQIYSLSPQGGAVSHDLWGNNSFGVENVLLANVDRQPGAEIISFASDASQLVAIDGEGHVLDGWPIPISGQGGRRQALVTELDAPDLLLGDLELVTLSSDRKVEVISLGPGSYDPAMMPWPLPSHDARASSSYTSPNDPLLVRPSGNFPTR